MVINAAVQQAQGCCGRVGCQAHCECLHLAGATTRHVHRYQRHAGFPALLQPRKQQLGEGWCAVVAPASCPQLGIKGLECCDNFTCSKQGQREVCGVASSACQWEEAA